MPRTELLRHRPLCDLASPRAPAAARPGGALARWLLLAGAAVALAACHPTPVVVYPNGPPSAAPAAPPAPGARGGIAPQPTEEQFLLGLEPALELHGFGCELSAEKDDLYCKHENLLNTHFEYKADESLLVFWASFGLKDGVPCGGPLLDKMNGANWKYNVAQVGCDGDVISFQTTLLVPLNGYSDTEFFAFLKWWSNGIFRIIKETGMVDDLD